MFQRRLTCLVFSILMIAMASDSAVALPKKGAFGSITCKTRLKYQSSEGNYALMGPTLSSRPFASYDGPLYEYYGDNVSFHANGSSTPDIGQPFFLSIEYTIYDRANLKTLEPLNVHIKLIDKRRKLARGGNRDDAIVAFNQNDEFTVAVDIIDQKELHYERLHGGDILTLVVATCKRERD